MKKFNLILLLTLALSAELPTLLDMLKQKDISLYDRESARIVKPIYQGKILEILHAKPYTYINIAEIHPSIKEGDNNTFWIAVNEVDAKESDIIRFQEEMVVKTFTSDVLKKKFDNLMFASNIEYKVN